ncbi:UNVERIFIED_CONTAM: hypothetical protein NCL1_37711 [Trichonephila clavipes]
MMVYGGRPRPAESRTRRDVHCDRGPRSGPGPSWLMPKDVAEDPETYTASHSYRIFDKKLHLFPKRRGRCGHQDARVDVSYSQTTSEAMNELKFKTSATCLQHNDIDFCLEVVADLSLSSYYDLIECF